MLLFRPLFHVKVTLFFYVHASWVSKKWSSGSLPPKAELVSAVIGDSQSNNDVNFMGRPHFKSIVTGCCANDNGHDKQTLIWNNHLSQNDVTGQHRTSSHLRSFFCPWMFFLPMRETQNFGFSRNDFFNFCVGQQNSTQSSGTTFPILWCCFGLEMKKTASLQSSFYVLLFTAFADKQVAKSVLSAVLHNIFIVSVFG